MDRALPLRRRLHRGFTLVEMLITFVVAAIVFTLGVGSLTRVIEDNRIRSVTEEFREGLALARNEAIQRNRSVRFDVSSTGWSVVLPDATPVTLMSKPALTDESLYTVTASTASITFASSGRPTSSNFQINVTRSGATCAAASGTNRCLRILVTSGGSIRSCDPAVASPDPRSCV
jgi:type IV fimbrial biogenesis protein FimT